MKGILFNEFFDMVEHTFSPEVADDILESASGTPYRVDGNYDHRELLVLMARLSEQTGQTVPALLEAFGEYLFGRFADLHPQFFHDVGSARDFLTEANRRIGAEVRKLYADAELPTLECGPAEGDHFTMTYHSSRPFARLACGLVKGCVGHFGEPLDVSLEELAGNPGTVARFTLSARKSGRRGHRRIERPSGADS